jgi:predicted MarR family transcription regulator
MESAVRSRCSWDLWLSEPPVVALHRIRHRDRSTIAPTTSTWDLCLSEASVVALHRIHHRDRSTTAKFPNHIVGVPPAGSL